MRSFSHRRRCRRENNGDSLNARVTFRRRAAAWSPVWGTVARVRHSACTTGTPSWRARSSAWLKPRRIRREKCSGTGMRQCAPESSSAPASCIMAPSGAASRRRPSYLNACRMSRSVPSYSPAARMALSRGVRHTGGGVRRTSRQHLSHTGPPRGASSTAAQAAHRGASVAARSACPSVESVVRLKPDATW